MCREDKNRILFLILCNKMLMGCCRFNPGPRKQERIFPEAHSGADAYLRIAGGYIGSAALLIRLTGPLPATTGLIEIAGIP